MIKKQKSTLQAPTFPLDLKPKSLVRAAFYHLWKYAYLVGCNVWYNSWWILQGVRYPLAKYCQHITILQQHWIH